MSQPFPRSAAVAALVWLGVAPAAGAAGRLSGHTCLLPLRIATHVRLFARVRRGRTRFAGAGTTSR